VPVEILLTALEALSHVVAITCPFAWVVVDVYRVLGKRAPELACALFFNLRPFYLTAATYEFIRAEIRSDFAFETWNVLNFLIQFCTWYLWMRHMKDDDDRWKKRLENLTERVAVSGSKLVVAPVGR
jgi:hypothetical protein